MGNANKFAYFHYSSLLLPADESLSFLTKLSSSTISLLLKRYKAFFIQKSYISTQEFKRLIQSTVILNYHSRIIDNFSHSFSSINIYEFFSVIITYSELNWQNKVTLLFKLFDFDKSKLLTKDELIILSKCFFKGIQTLTKKKFQLPFSVNSNSVHEYIFEKLESTDGISQQQLLNWVKGQRTLLQLFKQYSNDNLVTDKVPHILSKTFDKSCEVKIRSRRCSINRSTLEKESKNDWLTKIFQKACNRTKKAQVGNLYNLMAREPMLAVEAENFFSFFSFKLKTELSLPEFIKICKQIKVKKATIVRDTKSVIERRKSRTNTLDGKKNAKKEVILNIFDKYDINGDGVISISELKNGMRSFMSKETVQELFKEFDLDQSNTLDRDEFLRLFECTK